jgi:amidase
MARNVYDVAVALSAMTGADAADPSTKIAERHAQKDYYSGLKQGALKGARIGIVRVLSGQNAETDRVFGEALAKLRTLGADLIDPVEIPPFVVNAKSSLYMTVRTVEFATQIDAYLATLQPGYPRTLKELVARAEEAGSDYRNPAKLRNLRENLSAPGTDDPIYLAAANQGREMMRAAVDALFRKHRLDAIVFPTLPWPAGAVDALPHKLSESLLDLVPQIGFPELVVPAGYTSDGLPVTISFVSRPFGEPLLFSYAHDFERASSVRPLPRHTPALPGASLALRIERAGRDPETNSSRPSDSRW